MLCYLVEETDPYTGRSIGPALAVFGSRELAEEFAMRRPVPVRIVERTIHLALPDPTTPWGYVK